MTGVFAYALKELKEASTKWQSWVKGDSLAVKSEIEETQSDITCPELKTKIEEMKGTITREGRAELHFRISLHRDARYSLAGSQYCIRLAVWNRLRAQYETARAVVPAEIYTGD